MCALVQESQTKDLSSVWPDAQIKISPIFFKMCIKVATAVVIKVVIFTTPQKVSKFL